jgi:MFS family permease
MGVLWSMIRLGSAVSVLAGGYLRDRFGYTTSMLVIASMTALAIPLALALRWPADGGSPEENRQLGGWREAFQTPVHRWLLALGLLESVFEGVLVSTTSLFLADRLFGPDQPLLALGFGVGTVAGLLLAVRWVSGIVFGPLVGALADRIGHSNALLTLAILMLSGIGGAIGLGGWYPLLMLSLALLAGTGLFIILNAMASGVALDGDRPHFFIGWFSTAIDAGAASGPLLAYTVGGIAGLERLYLTVGGIFTLAAVRFWILLKR